MESALNGKVASSKRRPDSFGPFTVRTELGASRFGPVYLGRDSSTNTRVVIRTFELSREWREFGEMSDLVDAFRKLCETTLDHSSLARPLAFGTEGDIPYLAYAELPGTAMDVVMRQDGVRPVAEVLLRAQQLADAIDGAANAGVHHGMMAPCDVTLDGERTGVTGFGLAQALIKAEIPAEGVSPYASPQRLAGAPPTQADDVYSLAAITLELLIGTPRDPDQETRKLREAQGLPERRRLPRPAPHETRLFTMLAGVDAGKMRAAFAAAFSEEPGDRPSTAAEFVASFQDAFSNRRGADEPAPSVVAVPVVSEEREDPPSEPVLEQSEPVLATSVAEEAATLDEPASPGEPVVANEGRAARRRRARARRRERNVSASEQQATSEPIVQESPKPEPRERAPESRPPQPEPLVDFDVELVADVVPARALARVTRPHARSLHETSPANPIPLGSRAFLVAAVIVVSFSAGFGGGFVAGHFSKPSAEAIQASHPQPVTPPPPARVTVESPTPALTTTQAAAPIKEEKVASSAAIESGRLLVRSTPAGAAVVLDGQKRGITPLKLGELTFGAHTIEISHPGHGTRQQRVTLSARRPERSVDVRLRPTSVPATVPAQAAVSTNSTGSLQVLSRPSGAQVFVDENLIGTTPFVVSDIATGSRHLRIELSGYRVWTSSVRIEPSARSRVSASLEQ